MATPRFQLVDNSAPLHYHLVSRCVRGSWLCGKDSADGRDYGHRKRWIEERMFHLAKYFSIEIDAYAILSNHFHLVVYYDPTANLQWTDEDVAKRWTEAFPPLENGKISEELLALNKEQLLRNKPLLEDRRTKLGCLSTFMKHLKQPIARRANKEDSCKGHFFEQRFYSGALLSHESVLAAMAYVDLNPVRAKIAKSVEQCQNTSIATRLKSIENSLERLKNVIEPLVSGIGKVTHRFELTLAGYIDKLRICIENEQATQPDHLEVKKRRWLAQVSSIRKRQRAYGSLEEITRWIDSNGMKRLGACLPEK